MLSTSNVAVQFGAKPLFEQVTVKFSDGNRYGLIGANGSGKSTLMKVLGGDLELLGRLVPLFPLLLLTYVGRWTFALLSRLAAERHLAEHKTHTPRNGS